MDPDPLLLFKGMRFVSNPRINPRKVVCVLTPPSYNCCIAVNLQIGVPSKGNVGLSLTS